MLNIVMYFISRVVGLNIAPGEEVTGICPTLLTTPVTGHKTSPTAT